MGWATPQEARQRLAAVGARYLWIAYHDFAGVARAKAVGLDRLDDALTDGVGWAMANWDLAVDDHQVPIPSMPPTRGTSVSSRIRRRSARCRIDPALALAYGWMTGPDGTPWSGDPRGRLAAAERSLADRGLTARVGIEAELYLARPYAGAILRARRP